MPVPEKSMDIKEIRKANFEKLLAKYIGLSDGQKRTLRAFATEMHMSEVHLSQIKNGHRDIGSRLARKIEQQMTPPLAPGWMDHEHRDDDPRNLAEREMAKLVMQLYRENPRGVAATIKKLMRERDSAVKIGKRKKRSA